MVPNYEELSFFRERIQLLADAVRAELNCPCTQAIRTEMNEASLAVSIGEIDTASHSCRYARIHEIAREIVDRGFGGIQESSRLVEHVHGRRPFVHSIDALSL